MKHSPVTQQKLAEEVICSENISYGGVTSASKRLYSKVDDAQEEDCYVQI